MIFSWGGPGGCQTRHYEAHKAETAAVKKSLPKEARPIFCAYHRAAGLDARTFRRALRRKSSGNRIAPSESQRLRRSNAAKQVFAEQG